LLTILATKGLFLATWQLSDWTALRPIATDSSRLSFFIWRGGVLWRDTLYRLSELRGSGGEMSSEGRMEASMGKRSILVVEVLLAFWLN
jgi:hypothetical protein